MFSENNTDKVLEILKILKKLVEESEDSIFGDKDKAIQEIKATISAPTKESIDWLIAPTGNIQELSLENGWSDEFIILTTKLEGLM